MSAKIWCCTLALAACSPMPGQNTRAGEIERERQQKAANLKPDVPGTLERVIRYATTGEALEQATRGIPGLHLRVGGLVSGSGLAAGPEYLRRGLAKGNVVFRASARASYKLYQRYDLQLTLPHLAADHAMLDFEAVHRNEPSLNYYGPGPNSKKSGRTDYRYEDTSFNATSAVKILPRAWIGMTGGYLMPNVSRGRDRALASTEKVFTPAVTPGLDIQTNYLRGGPIASFDYRDNPASPREGGFYSAEYVYYSDREIGRYNFRRLNAEVQQYVPFFHETHVIAIRGKTELSYTDAGQVVPFYLQPVLGGLDDLRGFRPFRFYDDNLIVLNGEYRWSIFTGLDGVLFADEGKVFHRHSDFSLRHLEHSYGFGFRFSTEKSTFMRIETGFSREGFQIWVKFGDIFGIS